MRKPLSRRTTALILSALMISTLLVIAIPAGAQACGFGKWYLPEGYTGPNFDTYVLLQNPNDWEAKATVRFLTDSAVTDPADYELKANSRTTIKVNDVPGLEGQNVSTMVDASSGVVVERAMYFNDPAGGKVGGSDSIGANELSRNWYLAEGYTGEGFDTYVLVMNPNETAAHIKVTCYSPALVSSAGKGLSSIEKFYDVEPMRRFTIHADEIPGLENAEVSFKVESIAAEEAAGKAGVVAQTEPQTEPEPEPEPEPAEPVGIVAERAMYFTYHGFLGGHASIGAPRASSTWYLPEGRTAGEYDTYVLVMNPNPFKAHVKATFMVPAEGGAAGTGAGVVKPQMGHEPEPEPKPEPEPVPNKLITKDFVVEPNDRFTITVDQLAGLEATDVSTMVQSWAEPTGEGRAAAGECAPVVVERAMYFARGNQGDGHNSIGGTEKREYWLMAEGYTGGGFDTWILIQNPNEVDVNVRATFMKPDGEPIVKEYSVKKMSRLTIAVDKVEGLENTEVSTKLQVQGAVDGGRRAECSNGIVAERAMYFEYNGIVGGHCSLGVGE